MSDVETFVCKMNNNDFLILSLSLLALLYRSRIQVMCQSVKLKNIGENMFNKMWDNAAPIHTVSAV